MCAVPAVLQLLRACSSSLPTYVPHLPIFVEEPEHALWIDVPLTLLLKGDPGSLGPASLEQR